MFNRKQGIFRTLLFILANVLLTLVLVACGTSGGSGSTATPTPTPPPTPSPTPTSASLTVYMGTSFSISYPQGWKVTNHGTGGVEFTDPTDLYTIVIGVVADPNGLASADTVLTTAINGTKTSLKNPQTETIAPTTMVGGDTWSQKSESGDTTVIGKNTTVKFVAIADVHPASSSSSKAFIIVYGASKTTFDSANTTYFQSMLQSFKFA